MPPLVHLEVFLSHRWYCFLVLQLEHILSHRALSYSEFLPDLCWVVHCVCTGCAVLSLPSVEPCRRVCLSSIPPGSVWMLTQINFITHSFCILFLKHGTAEQTGHLLCTRLCKCVCRDPREKCPDVKKPNVQVSALCNCVVGHWGVASAVCLWNCWSSCWGLGWVVSVLFKELGLLVMSARLPVPPCATKPCLAGWEFSSSQSSSCCLTQTTIVFLLWC